MRSRPLCLIAAALLTAFPPGCHHDHDDTVVLVVRGTSAANFRSLADYLADPAVQAMFNFMPRHPGSTPPSVEGRYFASWTVAATSLPGGVVGEAVTSDFCLGTPSGASIAAAVVDPTVVDAGALSFIEGSGDFFTVYTAFKSVQTGPGGAICEIHEVVVFSGRREADGSLSALSIGLAIVGLLGDCGSLEVDQIQVSDNTAPRTGESCVGGMAPTDPTKVLVEVDNFLFSDLEVSVDGILVDTAPLRTSLTFEASPGFTLSFESVPPLNGNGDPMGEVLAGVFPADFLPAGSFSQYSIINQVGDDIYFAPLITNNTSGPVTARVNVLTAAERACNCSLAAGTTEQLIGYYFYDAPGLITASQTNVLIDTQVPAVNPPEFTFTGPFLLEQDSGAVVLEVP